MNERFEKIKPYIVGKHVLDVGCCGWYSRHVDENIPPYKLRSWLHNNIQTYANSVFCIDISKGCIDFLKEKGYNAEVGNAENFSLSQKFDVIVAAELIEHLSNFQGFLNSVKKHLKENGLLILTTPNVFCFREILLLLLRGHPPVNPEHVCYFDEVTLRQLLNRFGFSIEKVMYMIERSTCTMDKNCTKEPLKFRKLIFRFSEKIILNKKIKCSTIIMIAKNECTGKDKNIYKGKLTFYMK